LAWSLSECHFAAEPHDQPLTLVLTEAEVISP
jgi:5-formyltetrahydrofolate cyclo-ligase